MPFNDKPSPSQATQHYPVYLDLTGKTILVVGAGPVAARKIKRLTSQACHLIVLSPACTPEVIDMIGQHSSALWLKRWYSFEALDETQPHLVLACTNDAVVNQSIVEHCQRLGIFVNNATHSHFPGDMILPSAFSVCDEQLQIAVSTGSQSPMLTKYFRHQIAQLLETPENSRLLTLMSSLREQARTWTDSASHRQSVLEAVLSHSELESRIQSSTIDELLHWGHGIAQDALNEITSNGGKIETGAPTPHH